MYECRFGSVKLLLEFSRFVDSLLGGRIELLYVLCCCSLCCLNFGFGDLMVFLCICFNLFDLLSEVRGPLCSCTLLLRVSLVVLEMSLPMVEELLL